MFTSFQYRRNITTLCYSSFYIDDKQNIIIPKNCKYVNFKNNERKIIQLSLAVVIIVCVDDKFCKPFKTYFVENAIYNFINNMIKEDKQCSDVIKNFLTKKL